ncbi:MAG: cytochrome c biogenesis protein CcsA [Pirellulaceae bacterium]|nr:cytochrome c biogenesis protein CcsA [Pirellulaceae bacterium]
MLAILREISVTCFFTSYLVVLVLELLRLLGRIPGRGLAVVVMMGIGLFTHVCFVTLRAIPEAGQPDVGLLATWSDWSHLLALGLAVCFLVLYLRRPDTIVSFFFLPAVLATIGMGVAVRNMEPFSRSEAVGVWGSVHGLAMMIGAGAVLIGFLAGVMYLVQSRRLKHKRAGSALRLPTLETLGRMNRRCLVTSTIAVAVGVVAGIVMNLNKLGHVGWTDGGVLFSMLLFLWLVGTTALEFFYAPASRGRKAVYLTLASLGFLVLAMISVLTSSHGKSDPPLVAPPALEVQADQKATGAVDRMVAIRVMKNVVMVDFQREPVG